MTDGRYNYIFSALANDEDDILGQLAYSVYKRQKIEYIKAFKARNGFEPQDADLIAFHDISNSHSRLESYRTQAARLAKDFLDSCMSAESEELATFTPPKPVAKSAPRDRVSGKVFRKASLALHASSCCSAASSSSPGA